MVYAGEIGTQPGVVPVAWISQLGAEKLAADGTVRLDIKRSFTCVITMTDGSTVSNTSDAGSEGSGELEAPSCPAVPAGAVPARAQIYLSSPAASGGQILVFDQSTTGSYRAWKQNYPECGDGGCKLDLKKNFTSCFYYSTNCAGWIDDPSRGSDYNCTYGGHPVPLSECYPYGPTFNAGEPEAGRAYGDPGTGRTVDGQTSPTSEDRLFVELMKRGWDHWDTPNYSLGTGSQGNAARTVAKQCVALNITASCSTLPIFSPGADLGEATVHDFNAILGTLDPGTNNPGSRPAELTWADAASRSPSGWYSGTYPCNTSYDGQLQNCDEYPYVSTKEGGTAEKASLKLIDRRDNLGEGQYLLHFYNVCGVSSPTSSSGHRFVVVPIPGSNDAQVPSAPTSVWCKP